MIVRSQKNIKVWNKDTWEIRTSELKMDINFDGIFMLFEVKNNNNNNSCPLFICCKQMSIGEKKLRTIGKKS